MAKGPDQLIAACRVQAVLPPPSRLAASTCRNGERGLVETNNISLGGLCVPVYNYVRSLKDASWAAERATPPFLDMDIYKPSFLPARQVVGNTERKVYHESQLFSTLPP